MVNSGRFAVFVDTSLDTHFCLDVSFDETLDSLKRRIVAGHLVSFPSIGEINVHAVKLCREGTMYFLPDTMRVDTIFEGIQGTRFLYIEIETIKHERTLRNGRADEELMVPTEGMIEDLVVREVPHVDEVLSTDPPVKPAKKRRKKNATFEDTAVRLSESNKEKVEGFEGSSVQEEPGYITSKKKMKISGQSSNPAHTKLVNFDHENQTLEDNHSGAIACESKMRESMKWDKNDIEDGHRGDNSDKRRRKKEKGLEPANDGSVAVGEPHNMKDVAHEASLEEGKDISGTNLGQDSESPQIPDNANLMEPNISNPVEHMPTEELTSNTIHPCPNEEADNVNVMASDLENTVELIPTQNKVNKKEVETERNSQPGGAVKFHNQPNTDQTMHQRDANQGAEESARPNEEHKCGGSTSGMTAAVKEKRRKKHKETMSPSSDMPYEVLPIREDEFEKTDDKICKSNRVLEKGRDSEIQQKSAVGSATKTDYSIPCQLAKERMEPEISSLADRDIRLHNQLGVQQTVMADSKEEPRKDMENSKETTCLTGVDPGVVSVEKRRHKRKKVTSIKGLPQEGRENEFGQEKEDDLILEKEIGKKAEDTDLFCIAGGDPGVGVVSVKKRRHKKTKVASTDGLDQELSTGEKKLQR